MSPSLPPTPPPLVSPSCSSPSLVSHIPTPPHPRSCNSLAPPIARGSPHHQQFSWSHRHLETDFPPTPPLSSLPPPLVSPPFASTPPPHHRRSAPTPSQQHRFAVNLSNYRVVPAWNIQS
ncbi:hypothetical protein E2C01_013023 [Portunus trituberculatus]|uniref:Uncharacterized protein n=1 Tax=Portunus trituberculatus TaxID=210409 RepID=A0A5B7DF80_PORTR|nr:hypothetical protein [Portunus trituberculatus]